MWTWGPEMCCELKHNYLVGPSTIYITQLLHDELLSIIPNAGTFGFQPFSSAIPPAPYQRTQRAKRATCALQAQSKTHPSNAVPRFLLKNSCISGSRRVRTASSDLLWNFVVESVLPWEDNTIFPVVFARKNSWTPRILIFFFEACTCM